MLMLHANTAVRKLWSDEYPKTYAQGSPRSVPHTNNMSSVLALQNCFESKYMQTLGASSSFNVHSLRPSHHFTCGNPKEVSTRSYLHRWFVNASSDQDYRSSRNIAISVFKRYRNVIDRGGGENLKEFISAGVNAYALGCTDEGLRKELLNMKDSGFEIEGLQTYGGGTSVTFKIISEEVQECILWLSIVFITILCTPQPTVIRWSPTPPVSAETMHQWKGFCAIIANAYYKRGMAWLPVKTLQLEQMAVNGSTEEPSVVASRMRLVFSTLEVVSPQWPRV